MAVMDPPANYWDLVGQIPKGVTVCDVSADLTLDLIHVFVKDVATLEQRLKELRGKIVSNGMIWVSWPKTASKVETDLNENVVRELGLRNGLVDTKVCSVDETWSGLKFVIRRKDRES